MRKQTRLVLSKETLRSLEKNELGKAEGGAVSAATETLCCTGYMTCASCVATCGTRFC